MPFLTFIYETLLDLEIYRGVQVIGTGFTIFYVREQSVRGAARSALHGTAMARITSDPLTVALHNTTMARITSDFFPLPGFESSSLLQWWADVLARCPLPAAYDLLLTCLLPAAAAATGGGGGGGSGAAASGDRRLHDMRIRNAPMGTAYCLLVALLVVLLIVLLAVALVVAVHR